MSADRMPEQNSENRVTIKGTGTAKDPYECGSGQSVIALAEEIAEREETLAKLLLKQSIFFNWGGNIIGIQVNSNNKSSEPLESIIAVDFKGETLISLSEVDEKIIKARRIQNAFYRKLEELASK